ncbi:unnamed protein product [Cladocopium goreaui]|uniref:Dynein heavy chain tail domain-containing protein n=1 Tax=Cladocopium goreaui TaxID=2562237 RepID=A0A9P1GJF3_9DINO|nr:unnamed protein product [Cladocopium goreaui]
MARLLQKVLKVQVAGWFLVVNGVKFLVVGSWSGRAWQFLCSADGVAVVLEERREYYDSHEHHVKRVAAKSNRADEAVHFRDAFQCFLDNYFVNEDAAGAAAEKPAGSTPRRPASGDRVNRQHSGLGWWRATVRHSQELADNSARLCGRLAGILTDAAGLRAALPQLQCTDAGLMHDVQGFLELYSGARSGLSSAELLDLKRCHEAAAQLSEVQERLRQLTARCEKAGVDMCLDPDCTEAQVPRSLLKL